MSMKKPTIIPDAQRQAIDQRLSEVNQTPRDTSATVLAFLDLLGKVQSKKEFSPDGDTNEAIQKVLAEETKYLGKAFQLISKSDEAKRTYGAGLQGVMNCVSLLQSRDAQKTADLILEDYLPRANERERGGGAVAAMAGNADAAPHA